MHSCLNRTRFIKSIYFVGRMQELYLYCIWRHSTSHCSTSLDNFHQPSSSNATANTRRMISTWPPKAMVEFTFPCSWIKLISEGASLTFGAQLSGTVAGAPRSGCVIFKRESLQKSASSSTKGMGCLTNLCTTKSMMHAEIFRTQKFSSQNARQLSRKWTIRFEITCDVRHLHQAVLYFDGVPRTRSKPRAFAVSCGVWPHKGN